MDDECVAREARARKNFDAQLAAAGWQVQSADGELIARDKASLDIFWLRDNTLEDTENLPAPHVIAAEIYAPAPGRGELPLSPEPATPDDRGIREARSRAEQRAIPPDKVGREETSRGNEKRMS
jgi:hypothetical protein